MIRSMQGFRNIARMGLQTGPSGFGSLPPSAGPRYSPARRVPLPPLRGEREWEDYWRGRDRREWLRAHSEPPSTGMYGLGSVKSMKRRIQHLSGKQTTAQMNKVIANIVAKKDVEKNSAKLTLLGKHRANLYRNRTGKSAPVAPPASVSESLAPGWYNGSYWDGATWTTPPAGNVPSGGGPTGGGGGSGDGGTSDDMLTFSEGGSSEQAAGDDKLFTSADGTAMKIDPKTGKPVVADQAGFFNLKTMLVVGAVAFILVKLGKKKSHPNWTYAR